MAGDYRASPARSQNITTIGSGLTLTSGTLTNDLLTGKAGGQTAIGGTAANESLTLQGTAHATQTTSQVVCANALRIPLGTDKDALALYVGATANKVGFFGTSTNRLGVGIGGTWIMNLGPTFVQSLGVFYVFASSSTAPGYTTAADDNTGLDLPGSDVANLVSGAVIRVRAGLLGVELGSVGGLATDATSGFPFIPSCAGAPTGTFTSPTNMAGLVCDRTNHKVYFTDDGGTNWRLLN